MAKVVLDHAGVEFALYSGKYRSIRSYLLSSVSGGQIAHDPSGKVVVRALDNASLTISEGERVALLGKNGAGKSTLLRVISRAYRPTTGTATITGTVSSLIDISLGINPEATGRANIFLRAAMLGIPRRTMIERFDEIVEFSELGEFIEAPVRTYSSGMQLRLAFSVSTLFFPEILIMDEWLSVGDEGFREKAEKRLEELVSSSRILVLASHSRDLVERTCTRGILLDHGLLAMDGPIHEVAEQHFGPTRST